VLERWTRAVLRVRYPVVVAWVVVLAGGLWLTTLLPGLLSNSFEVPGSDSQRARAILAEHFGERPDGTFTVVFAVADPRDPAVRAGLRRRLVRVAHLIPTGKAGPLREGSRVLFADVATSLDLKSAKHYTDALRAGLRTSDGPRAYVTGQPAIQRDLDPVFRGDRRRGEIVAVSIALLVVLAVLGLSLAALIPFAFAACTIAGTLALVYAAAHLLAPVTYVVNLVELIGLGLAIDYSLLLVSRFREELREPGPVDDAVERTMATAGRTVVFSGAAVAIGLALLLTVPVPFVRSLGLAGFLIPVVSVAAALTLQPALLSLVGRRASARTPLGEDHRFWRRVAATTLRRPKTFLAVGVTLLLAAAAPLLFIEVTPGALAGLPRSIESMKGYALLRDRVGPGAITPIHVVTDAGRPGAAREPAVRRAVHRLVRELTEDGEAYVIALGRRAPYVDETGRYTQLIVVARHQYGAGETRGLVGRLRAQHIPDAGFPAGAHTYVGGAPAQGADFLARSYGSFVWVVLAVLALTFVALTWAFRSLLLPLKAVLLNLLTIAAVYGLLVLVFQWGLGHDIEGWVPIFLFAVLFGLSMDYEVFLVTRMREAWDDQRDNARAVTEGLERTGRVVSAAALIMVIVFSGFMVGRIDALRQLGFGLAVGVFIDATIVRLVLVPSLMAVLGRWNWWLPASVARIVAVRPPRSS
jgi:RND superfamily putative drug exporter